MGSALGAGPPPPPPPPALLAQPRPPWPSALPLCFVCGFFFFFVFSPLKYSTQKMNEHTLK